MADVRLTGDFPRTAVDPFALIGVPCQLHREFRDLFFGQLTSLCNGFNGMSIPIARVKILLDIRIRRVAAKHSLDDAHRLYPIEPVMAFDESQRPDRVANTHLISGLTLAFHTGHRLDAASLLGQRLRKPFERKCRAVSLPLKSAGEFADERARKVDRRLVCGKARGRGTGLQSVI